MSNPKFRVAICGGGIGGLALANALATFANDVHVDVYEATSTSSEIGAGIIFWKRSWFILQSLGLESTLIDMDLKPPEDKPRPGFILRKADQKEPSHNFHRLITPHGSVAMHRAILLGVLREGVSKHCTIHYNKRLLSYNQSGGPVTMLFADGTSAEADVVIGSDGINSATRQTMFSNPTNERFSRPSWTGTYCYRSLIDSTKVLKALPGHQATTMPIIYMGKDKHTVSYPIKGNLINYLSFYTVPGREGTEYEGPSVVDGSCDELVKLFEEWEPEARTLASCVEKCSRWAISQHRGTPFCISGKVALLGDAAHAMSTHLGAGASQSLEDAYILGRILAHPAVNLRNVEEALQVYQKARLPIANAVVERSRTTGLLYELNYPAALGCLDEDATEGDLVENFIDSVYGQWTGQWEGLPSEDWARAEALLINTLGRSDDSEISIEKTSFNNTLGGFAISPQAQVVA
ncbi:FAD/NAD-binding domain-containing protein [Schizopora paradoxa]|uniref:FAD/NAD-binding domain-containing protein n=1 Tax=Schizopora paradoxa TaxID=27342 RepID=A0A0H2S941_9AGAM|nr:FAD/NAD-binding domain-containing protein [Schizopora paradoxa]